MECCGTTVTIAVKSCFDTLFSVVLVEVLGAIAMYDVQNEEPSEVVKSIIINSMSMSLQVEILSKDMLTKSSVMVFDHLAVQGACQVFRQVSLTYGGSN